MALFLAGVTATSGCSWLFVQPPPKGYDGRGPVHCTTSRVAPAFDTIFTGTNIASAIYVAGQDNAQNKEGAVIFGLGVAGLWLASAIYGYSNTAECEEAMAGGGGYSYPPPRRAPPARRAAPVAPPPPPAAASPAVAPPPADVGDSPIVLPDNQAPAPPRPQQLDNDDPDAVRPPRPRPPGY
jgi:hypothetical protein